MTREEIIKWLESLKAEIGKSEHRSLWHYAEAIDMAIEALSEETIEIKPIEIKGDFHIDDDYKKPPQIIGNVEVVVRCKDCRHIGLFSCPLADNDFQKDDDYCSWGERREPTE